MEITSQNHGFAVDPDSLPGDVKVTHLNLYDGTVEGLRVLDRPIYSVQYHPEASPGPHDADYLFKQFVEDMEEEAIGLIDAAKRRSQTHSRDRRRPDRDRAGVRVRLLGTQACKALRSEGLEVILINSNPATIMTDPEMADRTYIEPLTVEAVTKVIEKERPDAILPTVGGQTALNLAVALHEAGVLERVRRHADRRERRRDQAGRRSSAVPRRDEGDRPRDAGERAGAIGRRSHAGSSRPPAFRRSSAPRSRWAASAAASPTTSRNSASSSSAGSK